MNKKVLIVEDQYVEAYDLQLMLEKAGYEVCGIARSVPIAMEMIASHKPGLVLLDIFLKGKQTGIDLAKKLREDNVAFIFLSANSNEEILSVAKTTEPYGFILKPFREKDLLVTLEIARYRHQHSFESQYRREKEVLHQLDLLQTSTGDRKEMYLQLGKLLQPLIPFDFLAIGFDNAAHFEKHAIGFLRIGFNEYQTIGVSELLTIARISMSELVHLPPCPMEVMSPKFVHKAAADLKIKDQSLVGLFRKVFKGNSILAMPLQKAGENSFTIFFFSKRDDTYTQEHISLLKRLHENLRKGFRLTTQSVSNETAKQVFPFQEDSVNTVLSGSERFDGIIGSSHLLLNVFDQIAQVAPFDTSVLILGESGTGKEKIADAIHITSPRKEKPLIKINCATLPATLIESELFGHEKGSFTGANEKRIGKFELANGGSIFLDEIGEMPVDLQIKLLRVLQEKEIETIGGRRPVKINVRMIAATNRNLEKEVAEGRFRLDLYYRLNVFPIVLPPLRERMEDLPDLANHFIDQCNKRTGKQVLGLSEKALKKLQYYHWPGNIRELENIMERNVLMAKGNKIEDVALPSNSESFQISSHLNRLKSISENEREYIISVLKKCKGKVWGSGGAAEALNMPPSTLKSKMIKLDISKESWTK